MGRHQGSNPPSQLGVEGLWGGWETGELHAEEMEAGAEFQESARLRVTPDVGKLKTLRYKAVCPSTPRLLKSVISACLYFLALHTFQTLSPPLRLLPVRWSPHCPIQTSLSLLLPDLSRAFDQLIPPCPANGFVSLGHQDCHCPFTTCLSGPPHLPRPLNTGELQAQSSVPFSSLSRSLLALLAQAHCR